MKAYGGVDVQMFLKDFQFILVACYCHVLGVCHATNNFTRSHNYTIYNLTTTAMGSITITSPTGVTAIHSIQLNS
jgi:hypothetical protein